MAAYRREEYLVGDELDLLTDFEEDFILEPGVWEVGDQYTLCVCNVPSTENLVRCSEQDCSVKWFHRECAGLAKLPAAAARDQAEAAPAVEHEITITGCGRRSTSIVTPSPQDKDSESWICNG